MEITFNLAVKRQDFKEVHSRYEHVKRGRVNGNMRPSYMTDCVTRTGGQAERGSLSWMVEGFEHPASGDSSLSLTG